MLIDTFYVANLNASPSIIKLPKNLNMVFVNVFMNNIWLITTLIFIMLFFLATNNISFFYTLLLVEILWILVFFYGCTLVSFYNSITILTWTLLLLCIATSESAIGLTFVLAYFDQFQTLPDNTLNSSRFQTMRTPL